MALSPIYEPRSSPGVRIGERRTTRTAQRVTWRIPRRTHEKASTERPQREDGDVLSVPHRAGIATSKDVDGLAMPVSASLADTVKHMQNDSIRHTYRQASVHGKGPGTQEPDVASHHLTVSSARRYACRLKRSAARDGAVSRISRAADDH